MSSPKLLASPFYLDFTGKRTIILYYIVLFLIIKGNPSGDIMLFSEIIHCLHNNDNYNMTPFRSFSVLAIVSCFFGCASHGYKSVTVEKDKSLDCYMADTNSLNLFVLYDSSHEDFASLYMNRFCLENEKVLKNVDNISFKGVLLDKSYEEVKILKPNILPISILFWRGRILDIVPGISSESVLYLTGAILKRERSVFHYNHYYGEQKDSIIHVIEKDIGLTNLDYATTDFLSIYYETMDPYVLAFVLNASFARGDKYKSVEYAQMLRNSDDITVPVLFQDELKLANTLIDSEYYRNGGPLLKVQIQDRIANANKEKIILKIMNIGDRNLHLYDFRTDCGCVAFTPPPERAVAPLKFVQMIVEIPRVSESKHSLTIISNSSDLSVISITL